MAQYYFKGDLVQITNSNNRMYGKVGKIDDYSVQHDCYGIVFGTPGTLGSYYDWYDLGDFYPVSSGVQAAPIQAQHSAQSTWIVPPQMTWGSKTSSNVSFDMSDSNDIWGSFEPTYSFSNSRCNHKWVCDYKSIFTNQEYYSCSKCKIKREEWEKEHKEDIDDGVPF